MFGMLTSLWALRSAVGFVLPEVIDFGAKVVAKAQGKPTPPPYTSEAKTLKGSRTIILLVPWIVGHAAAAFGLWSLPIIWDDVFATAMGITASLKLVK